MRKELAAAALIGALVGGCATTSDEDTSPTRDAAATCAPTPPADVGTADGWLGYLAAHPEDVGVSVTATDGRVIEHNADEPFPTASAIKLVHLAAYADGVAAQKIRPDDTVTVGEWERWYFPIDGGAHRRSLAYLGIPERNGVATQPDRPVSYRQLADVMIRFSDSAAPDLFRDRLGDDALAAIMRRYGIGDDAPSLLGMYLGTVDPTLRTAADRDRAAQRYTTDVDYARARLDALRTADLTAPQSDSPIRATPHSLSALIGALADGTFGPGAPIAREILEYQGPQPDGGTLGFKGGSLPGVLTDVFEYRGADGGSGVGTVMVRNLSAADASRNDFAHQEMLLRALTEPAFARALDCAS